jgi:hypothetical protein
MFIFPINSALHTEKYEMEAGPGEFITAVTELNCWEIIVMFGVAVQLNVAEDPGPLVTVTVNDCPIQTGPGLCTRLTVTWLKVTDGTKKVLLTGPQPFPPWISIALLIPKVMSTR